MTADIQTMASVSLSSLPISFSLKATLAGAGYKVLSDLEGLTGADLSAELNLPAAQIDVLLSCITAAQTSTGALEGQSATTQTSPIKSSTAAELLSSASIHRFSTLSPSLDRLIAQFSPSLAYNTHIGVEDPKRLWHESKDGAIVPGMSVEISGPPGAGKTVLAIALAINARMSEEGQDGAEVLVIDTEGGITPHRLQAAARATMGSSAAVLDILRGIHFVRIPTQVQMIGFLHTLDDWVDENPKVKLVIIDTLSYHFRQPNMDMNARRRIMDMVKQKVGKITTVNRCAVVITSQLATKLLTSENKPANFDTGDRAVLMPQLGDSWTTGKTLRLVLFRGGKGDDLRYAHASSANVADEEYPWVRFDIDANGLPCDLLDAAP